MNKWADAFVRAGPTVRHFTNNADEGVGRGPGGPPYIKLRTGGANAFGLYKCRRGRRPRSGGTALHTLMHERPMQITVHCLQ